MRKTLLAITLILAAAGVHAQVAIGQWRDHLSFQALNHVCCAGDRVYAASSSALFYFDREDGTTNRMTKTTQLNDVGVSTFAYDPTSHYLVVAYSNANIDIIKDDKVTNLSDIKRNNIGGDKRINAIRFHNRCAYLACAFGIVVVDLDRKEIKETYYLGPDGTYANIHDVAFTDSLIIAATDNGMLTADKDNRFLNIVGNWHADTLTLLAGMPVHRMEVTATGDLLAVSPDEGDSSATLYRGTPDALAPWLTGDIRSLRTTGSSIVVVRDDATEIYDDSYQQRYALHTIDWMAMDVNDATLSADGTLWMAHQWAGLCTCQPSNPEATLSAIIPSGPASDDVYRLVSFDDKLYVCPGGHSSTYTSIYTPATLYTFADNRWSQMEDPDRLASGLYDIIHVAVNPRNKRVKMAASWGGGIVEITDNSVTAHYDHTNSDNALTPYIEGTFQSLRTGGVAFDRKGDLWITNSLQPYGLAVRHNDGTWQRFYTMDMVQGIDIDNILCDSIHGLKLFWGRSNRIFVHDGDQKMAYIDPNNGARLETATVNCMAQDHNGAIWVGTNKGIKVIYDLSKAFQNGGNGEKSPVICSNILFSENGINEYLMAYENITSIAVDGANRKWIGTNSGGLYLVAANGLKQLEHFTAAESPLFSDKIVSLSIMPWSGELFIGTDRGIQSYRTTATYAYATPQDDIHAFPNPVKPDYEGVIAIKGFSRNALVHITDAAGHTVFSTTANGGQAIWDGCTNSGKRVASGVYYVFASSEEGDMRSVTKILIVR